MRRAFDTIPTVVAATIAKRVAADLRSQDFVRVAITRRIYNHARSALCSDEEGFQLSDDFISTRTREELAYIQERDGMLGVPADARHDRAKLAYQLECWAESIWKRAVA